MKFLKMKVTSICIEYHWWHIMRYRKTGGVLIERGESLSSEKLVSLSTQITRHGMRALELQDKFEQLYSL
jgi:hypothetical protein